MTTYPTIEQLHKLRRAVWALSLDEFSEIMRRDADVGPGVSVISYKELQDAPAHWLCSRMPQSLAEAVMNAAQDAFARDNNEVVQ